MFGFLNILENLTNDLPEGILVELLKHHKSFKVIFFFICVQNSIFNENHINHYI